MISFSGQSTPVTLEQKSSRRAGSSRRNNAIARARVTLRSSECCAAGAGLVTIAISAPGKRASARSRSCSRVSMGRSLFAHDRRRLPHGGILRRTQVVFAKFRDGIFAAIVGAEMAWGVGAGNALAADFFLQRDQAVEQGFGAGWAAGNVDVDGDEAVDALQDVVALLE